MATWTTIRSAVDYDNALERINALMDADRTDGVRNELGLLSYLVQEYEEVHYPIPDASPLEVIKFIMEMKGIQQQDLIPILGTKGNVSKILNGKANIQLEDIHPLSLLLGIPVEALIPKVENHDVSIGVIAEYADPVKNRLIDIIGTQKMAADESELWGIPAHRKQEREAKKKSKIKR